jgi:predicted DCC family thiol-disulfide oxidoreductase YuxK
VGEAGALTERVILFYDRACPVCRLFARLFLLADTERRMRTAPLDSPQADRLIGHLPHRTRYGSYHLVVGNRLASGGAGIGVLLEQPRLIRPVGRLVRRFRALRRLMAGLYRLIARNRARMAPFVPRVDLPR